MAKKNEALFDESSQGSVSAVTAIMFVLSMVLAFGGLVFMSYAFDPTIGGTQAFLIFAGGLLASVIGFALPFNILPKAGK